MASPEFIATLNQLRARTLAPSEHNRGELAERIRTALSALPSTVDEHAPWLGSPGGQWDPLRRFADLPQTGRDPDDVLRTATAGLLGQLRWHSPASLYNIVPTPLLDSVAVAAVANLYNPNALWDFLSASTLEIERQVIGQLAGLVDWPREAAGGVFSFGGKAALIYAIRAGLNRCQPAVSREGLAGTSAPVVVTTQHCHDSVEQVCSLLGLGTRACVRIAVTADETLDPAVIGNTLSTLAADGVPIAAVVISGGNILHGAVDPVQAVAAEIDKVRARFNLSYRPYLHVDTAFGWSWLFFADYDFQANPLGLESVVLRRIWRNTELLKGIDRADSCTVDFHKTGFCPYACSAFITRDAAELRSLTTESPESPRDADWGPWGENLIQGFTLEHSRSAAPVLAAWVALQSSGVTGFRVHLAHSIAVDEAFRRLLPCYGFELLNPDATGFASLYWPVPPSGPRSFAELRDAGSGVIEEANRYTYALSRALAGLDGEPTATAVVGFLPSYARTGHDPGVSVLRVLPTSPHHDESTVDRLVPLIASAKKAFDDNACHRFGQLDQIPLTEIPV